MGSYGGRLVNKYDRFLLATVGVFDAILGVCLLLWPGLWQEWAHPLAMGTVFYHLQRIGALWALRSIVELYAAFSGRRDLVRPLALWWFAEIVGDLLILFRGWETGEWVPFIYGGRAVLDLGVFWLLCRCAGNKQSPQP